MKKTLVKSIKISFQEKTSKGFVDCSFDTPKEHLEWHLSQMQVGSNGVDASEKESWCKTARHSAVALLSGVLV